MRREGVTGRKLRNHTGGLIAFPEVQVGSFWKIHLSFQVMDEK
jgi:hypothetical protein